MLIGGEGAMERRPMWRRQDRGAGQTNASRVFMKAGLTGCSSRVDGCKVVGLGPGPGGEGRRALVAEMCHTRPSADESDCLL